MLILFILIPAYKRGTNSLIVFNGLKNQQRTFQEMIRIMGSYDLQPRRYYVNTSQ